MNIPNNQRWMETDHRLQMALLSFMEQKKQPTVGELCELTNINRSTFYRHYLDIHDLMEKTEQKIQNELVHALQPVDVSREISAEALIPLIETIGKYRYFYQTYLKTHLDVSMEAGMQKVWETQLKPVFLSSRVTDENRMLYYYQFIKAGMMSILKLWLDRNCEETPDEIAGMMAKLIKRY